MDNSKSILFVTDALGYGGAEKQIVFAAEGLLNRGWKVSVLYLRVGGASNGIRNVDQRIQLYVEDILYNNAIQFNYDLVKRTLCKTRQVMPAIIIGFTEIPNFCVSVVGQLCGIPSVISERADPFFTYKNAPLSIRLKLWCINRSTGGVFQTMQASLFYSARLRKNSVVIPNPVFVKEELPPIDYANMPNTVISLGRLYNRQKRYDVMLRAFSKFHTLHPEYELKIYGNGQDEDSIIQWIKDLGLESSVKMMGISSHPLQEFSKGGIFLITSDYEGISNSLLEAMACGLPVVATDHTPGGARLLIKNEENGLLVPIRDEDAICNALAHYADSDSLRFKCGTNARKVLVDYSPERVLDMWESYINKLIAS